MFSCLQILEAFLWFVLITLLNVTLIILTLSVSRLLNLLLRLVAFLLFLNPQCLASISRWITASRDRKSGSAGMPRPISYAVFCLKKKTSAGAFGASYRETAILRGTRARCDRKRTWGSSASNRCCHCLRTCRGPR